MNFKKLLILLLNLNIYIYIYFIYLSKYKIFFTEIIVFVEKTKTSYGCYNNNKKKIKNKSSIFICDRNFKKSYI
jgi:hypothetical protein